MKKPSRWDRRISKEAQQAEEDRLAQYENIVSHIPMDATMLQMIATQLDNFPLMMEYVSSAEMYPPSRILTPDGLSEVSLYVLNNSTMFLETVGFMNTIGVFEIFQFGDAPDTAINMFLKVVSKNRKADHKSELLTGGKKGSSPDFILSRNEKAPGVNEDPTSYLDKNRPVLAVYLYALILTMVGRNKFD